MKPKLSPALIQGLFIVLVLGLAAIPFGLGKYCEFNSPEPFDSSAYVYSAKRVLDGARAGVDEAVSAKVGTFIVNLLGVWLCGFSEVGPKLIQALLQGTALILMFFSLRRLFGTLAAAVSIIVAAVYLSAPVIARTGNIKEQYMTASMVLGISCFILGTLSGRWWWTILAGASLVWAPLFKETGVSAQAAIGLFIILQPILRHNSFKQTGRDILLLLIGAVVSLAPVFVWMEVAEVRITRPYQFVWKTLAPVFQSTPPVADSTSPTVESARPAETDSSDNPAEVKSEKPKNKGSSGYISASRVQVDFSRQFPVVMRYYRVVILPIVLALGAILGRIVKMILRLWPGLKTSPRTSYDRFVLLLAVWWLLDMAFVWISPRPYEQYYLPLTASGAMLGGYLIALYAKKIADRQNRTFWLLVGVVGFVAMIFMSWHIFVGLSKSPYHGQIYRGPDGKPERRRGYAQQLHEVGLYRKGAVSYPWEMVGDYIRNHSRPEDKIYVWGWYPGIYVRAQRLSSVPRASFSEMHNTPPAALILYIDQTVRALQNHPPKFIVDPQFMLFPYFDHPNFDLWPRWLDEDKTLFDLRPSIYGGKKKIVYVTKDELEKNQQRINQQVEHYCFRRLTDKNRQDGSFDEKKALELAQTEVARHEATSRLRQFVMTYYRPVVPADSNMFIFELKKGSP